MTLKKTICELEASVRKLAHMKRKACSPTRPVDKERFTVSKTYDVVFKDQKMDLRDVLREVEDMGAVEPQFQKNLIRMHSADAHNRTGDETSYGLHIRGSESALRRLWKLLKAKNRWFR